jgi:hypothetical protein
MAPRTMSRRTPPALRLPTTPTIVIFRHASARRAVALPALVTALRKFLNTAFVPVWGTPARLVTGDSFVRGAWAIGIFASTADATEDGYHDLTPEGLPFARVYLENIRRNDDTLGEMISHELVEMLVDPLANLAAECSPRVFYDLEVADPVQEHAFEINGIPMTDFVYPAWFVPSPGAPRTRYDHLGLLRRPFQILRAGYARKFRGGKWRDVWGSAKAARRFEDDERASHRRGMRSGSRRRRSEIARAPRTSRAERKRA